MLRSLVLAIAIAGWNGVGFERLILLLSAHSLQYCYRSSNWFFDLFINVFLRLLLWGYHNNNYSACDMALNYCSIFKLH